MGKTKNGKSAPWCPSCQTQTLKLRDKFGTPCPKCGTETVWYHAYKFAEMNGLRRVLREGLIHKNISNIGSDIEKHINTATDDPKPVDWECASDMLHIAICQALGLMSNQVLNADTLTAYTILRKAMDDYANSTA